MQTTSPSTLKMDELNPIGLVVGRSHEKKEVDYSHLRHFVGDPRPDLKKILECVVRPSYGELLARTPSFVNRHGAVFGELMGW